MIGPDDVFGSNAQEPGNTGEPDADQRMRDHDEVLAQLRADRKLAYMGHFACLRGYGDLCAIHADLL